MFPRVSRITSGDKTYEYLQIVEARRDRKGRSRHHVIASLGRLDLIQGNLDALLVKLRRFCRTDLVLPNEISNEASVPWGPVLVIRHLWEELGLDRILRELCQSKRRFDVAERAFVMVVNRLVEPGSEHGLARWLERIYVCDKHGKRFLPEWLPVELVTKQQRVKVPFKWLNVWYRTLDALLLQKEAIEKALYSRLRNLFNLQVDIVFYDLTTLYFERRQPKGKLRRHGPTKDGRPRNVQVILGVVMIDGFPLSAQIFEGNRSEKKTVKEVIGSIQNRFEIRDVVFVADSGMQSAENRDFFASLEGYSYLWGHKSRRSDDAKQWLEAMGTKWTACGPGTRVQEVPSGKEGMRVFLVQSDERKPYEEALRKKSMDRVKQRMDKIVKAVSEGRLKRPEKIGARAARALKDDHGARYFSWECPGPGEFRYYEDKQKLAAEIAREGIYLLTTNQMDIEPTEAVQRYKELSDVEDGFRQLKDLIRGRPVFHKRDERVCGHLFVAQLALIVLRQLRRRLQEAGETMSAPDALLAVKSLGVAELDLNGQKLVLPSRPTRDAKRVLSALNINDIQPPATRSRSLEASEPTTREGPKT